MALLIQSKGDKLPVILLTGSLQECVKEGKTLDAKGEGGLQAWDDRDGVVWIGKGLTKRNLEAKAASKKRQQIAIEERSAVARVKVQEAKTASAEADLARAQERVDAAKAEEAEAAAVAKAKKTTTTKKAAKKTAK